MEAEIEAERERARDRLRKAATALTRGDGLVELHRRMVATRAVLAALVQLKRGRRTLLTNSERAA